MAADAMLPADNKNLVPRKLAFPLTLAPGKQLSTSGMDTNLKQLVACKHPADNSITKALFVAFRKEQEEEAERKKASIAESRKRSR